MPRFILNSGSILILWFEKSKCLFLSFFLVPRKLKLWLNVETTKWHILTLNKVALFIKNSKDSKTGVKSYYRPLHCSFLANPLKDLFYRYFKIGAWKFYKMYLKLIFRISPFIWNENFSLESTLTLYWTVLTVSTKLAAI